MTKITTDAQALADLQNVQSLYGIDLSHVIDHLSARLASTSPAPDGWVLVPVEPTNEMLDAPSSIVQRYAAGLIWKRMLAFALLTEKTK